jgi:flagellar basal body P-ring protein FlgI
LLACWRRCCCRRRARRRKHPHQGHRQDAGWRENALTGYGLVTGLAGTGDSARNKATRQSIANMLSRFDMTLVADDVQSRNVAAVMVTASLPPFARAGDTLDVTVTSIGDARSLVGGTLILAPLKGPTARSTRWPRDRCRWAATSTT